MVGEVPMRKLSPGDLFYTNHFGSANEFGIILERNQVKNVYRVILSSGKIGLLDRSYLLVGDEMCFDE